MFEQMSRYGDGQSDRRGRMTFELQRWSEDHWHDFATLHRDADLMADLGGPFDDTTSREKFDRYRQAWDRTGISQWAVVDRGREQFSGYAGVMLHGDPDHPLGEHFEVGWRFRRDVCGQGLAAASAREALERAWTVLDVPEIVSYTAAHNVRSQNVMRRLGLKRDMKRDFTARYPRGEFSGLTWIAQRPNAGGSMATP